MFQRYKNRRYVFITYFMFSKHLIDNYFQLKKVNDSSDNNMS